MKNLIIIDGTSAIWKGELISYVNESLPTSSYVTKLSTRSKRSFDTVTDLKLKNDTDLSDYNLEYRYDFGGNHYGFSKEQIDSALSKHANVFIVVRNQQVIKSLQQDYSRINVFTVFVYSDKAKIDAAFSKTEENNKDLLNSIEQASDDYSRTPDLYSLVIINSKEKNDFKRMVDFMISSAQKNKRKRRLPNLLTSKRSRSISTIILVLFYPALLGLAIDIFTSGDITRWSMATLVLSVALTVILTLIHIFIEASDE